MKDTVPRLLRAWRDEKANDDIIPLGANLQDLVKNLLEKMEASLSTMEGTSIEWKVVKREISLIKYTWEDLLSLRKQKIDGAVNRGVTMNLSHLLDFEEEYYSTVLNAGETYSKHASISLEGDSMIEGEGESNVLVYITKDGEGIVDSHLRYYGPFKKEDIVFLPRENARLMVKSKNAKWISSKGTGSKKA